MLLWQISAEIPEVIGVNGVNGTALGVVGGTIAHQVYIVALRVH